MVKILAKRGSKLLQENSPGAHLRKRVEEARRPKADQKVKVKKLAEKPATLAILCAATLAFQIHQWQEIYCNLLERLRTEKGCRFLVTAPPQLGKTIITSQRLPAYLLGWDPEHRVRLACYNETHAADQGAVVRDIMASAEYRAWFPNSAISPKASAHEFSTPPRLALKDAQPSFRAMGLLSGFVGTGADTLIIDDPYASADAARSEAINESVWRWWSQTAKVRIADDCNVVCMFHPYHDDDLMARLAKEGGWEIFRFPAIADEETCEFGTDLTLVQGIRKPGEPLSPLRSVDYFLKLEASDPITFAAQFQGRPKTAGGGTFKISELRTITAYPSGIIGAVRAWDLAATSGAGDYTVGVLVVKLRSGRYAILDAVILQGSPEEVDEAITETAAEDKANLAIKDIVTIRLARDPGSAGKRDAAYLVRMLPGWIVNVVTVTGSKVKRARSFASQMNVGNVDILEAFGRIVKTGPYLGRDAKEALVRMFAAFPWGVAKKDGVDACADAFTELEGLEVTGVDSYSPQVW